MAKSIKKGDKHCRAAQTQFVLWLEDLKNYRVLGLELNEYAAELARVTVWIGELQWRIEVLDATMRFRTINPRSPNPGAESHRSECPVQVPYDGFLDCF